MQCENFVTVIFYQVAFAIRILFSISLFMSVLGVLTIVVDGLGLNLARINKIDALVKATAI